MEAGTPETTHYYKTHQPQHIHMNHSTTAQTTTTKPGATTQQTTAGAAEAPETTQPHATKDQNIQTQQ